jgi:hypothetical protein
VELGHVSVLLHLESCCSVGNLSLTKSLKELRKITQPMQPILLTIMAEEVRTGVNEPLAMSSEVQIALIMSELDNTPPYFDSDKYVSHGELHAWPLSMYYITCPHDGRTEEG